MWTRSVFSLPNSWSRLVARSVPSMIAASIIHGVVVERPHRQLTSGQLARKRTAWGRCLARVNVEENGTGRTVGRVLIERVVRYQHEFLSDLRITQALSARVPGLLVCHVGWPGASTKFISRVRVDWGESKRIHVVMVRPTKSHD